LAARVVGQPLERVQIASLFLVRSTDPPVQAAVGRRCVGVRLAPSPAHPGGRYWKAGREAAFVEVDEQGRRIERAARTTPEPAAGGYAPLVVARERP
jgi:hypothetical protein